MNLLHVTPGGRPKGFVPYAPRTAWKQIVACRILDVFEEMRAADALPLGPRQVGYRLKERHGEDTYPKACFPRIEEAVKRLGQARRIPWTWIADASSVDFDPGGYDDPAHFLREVAAGYERDLRQGQLVVPEIVAEARETLPLIRRVAHERGVRVYSGSGSSGPKRAHAVAGRAVERAVERGQSTVICGICDFDIAGIRNVLRPHLDNVASFLHPLDPRNVGGHVVGWKDSDGIVRAIEETNAFVSFEHLALTPEQALPLLDCDADRETVVEYLSSGTDLWSRDTSLLQGVQKIEIEAFDPRNLRGIVVAALDSLIDAKVLNEVRQQSRDEHKRLDGLLTKLAEAETP